MMEDKIIAEYLDEALDHMCNCESGKQFAELGIVDQAVLLGLVAHALTAKLIESDREIIAMKLPTRKQRKAVTQ